MIEFRGERVDNGEEVFGCLLNYTDNSCHINIWTERHQTSTKGGKPFYSMYSTTYEIHPHSLAQFTGKLDKNGTKIFGSVEVDGEMSKGGSGILIDGKTKSQVVYSTRLGGFLVAFWGSLACYSTDQLEVIPKGDKS